MEDEPRRRMWLLLVFLNFTALLLALLLYPEFAVLGRFQEALCTVEGKAAFRFYESQAKITVNVTVGEDTFRASACNPIDCDVNGGGFMDKREWLQMYRLGETYPCLYDPQRDENGFQWVVFAPPVYTVTLWLVLLVCAAVGVFGSIYTLFQHIRENGLQTHRVTGCLVAAWGSVRGAVVRRAQKYWPWKGRPAEGIEMEAGRPPRAGSSESLPPAYEPPPPAYEDYDVNADTDRASASGNLEAVELGHSSGPGSSRGYARLTSADD